jgi:hypothetical protein
MEHSNFFRSGYVKFALGALTVLACSSAPAQWLWIDAAGNKVFSDTAPTPEVPEKNILKRPGMRSAPPTLDPENAAATPAPQAAAPLSPPKPSGRDAALEAKKKQAEEAELAKKKAEAEKVAKARAENCDRAKRAKATLDSGVRLATTNDKGEREIMDDKARAGETQRLNEIIRSDCGPAPQAQAQ